MDSPVIARTGILQYRNDDGSIRKELRLPEDVFHEDSLLSYKGKPITLGHPQGLVNSENIKDHQIGTMLAEARKDGDEIRADIVIHQPAKLGNYKELSVGYDVELDETPGEWNGQRYDAIQRKIRVNHLSVVKSARAGRRARLNLDSDELIDDEQEKPKMPKIRLDNDIEYEASQEVINELVKVRKDASDVKTALTEKETQVQTLTGERDVLKTRVDAFPAELETAKAAAIEAAKASLAGRAKLVETAKSFKVDADDAKTDKEIKVAVIKSQNKDFDDTGKSDDYLNAAFDMIVATRKDTAMKIQRGIVNGIQKPALENRNDEADPETVYRERMLAGTLGRADAE